MFHIQQATKTPYIPPLICNNTCFTLWDLVTDNEFIHYSYSVRYVGTNSFGIRIQLGGYV